MRKEGARAQAILESAMGILCERGDHGLTMRKVADAAGISLGHLQHYFPTRNDVLKALVGRHFAQCTEHLQVRTREYPAADREARVACLVAVGLDYVGDEPTCRIFREFWALASRNEAVREHLEAYYREYCALLTAFLTPVAESAEAARAATALLMPWFEGYNVTARALETDEAVIARRLQAIVVQLLRAP